MLLKNKNLVIYGGGGSVGTVVAKAFANEGAKVFLTGHHIEAIQRTANHIIESGGYAEYERVDALDPAEVEAHLDKLLLKHNHVDISFNLIGMNDIQGLPVIDLETSQFLEPVNRVMNSHFITARATAKQMIKQRSGVILTLSANAAKKPCENVGGFGIACASIEALSRQLAAELGKYNIRVVCLRSAGSPDAKGVHEVFEEHAMLANISISEFERKFAEKTMLKRLPKLIEIANAAILVASDKASAITAAVLNVTCGELSD